MSRGSLFNNGCIFFFQLVLLRCLQGWILEHTSYLRKKEGLGTPMNIPGTWKNTKLQPEASVEEFAVRAILIEDSIKSPVPESPVPWLCRTRLQTRSPVPFPCCLPKEQISCSQRGQNHEEVAIWWRNVQCQKSRTQSRAKGFFVRAVKHTVTKICVRVHNQAR